MIFKVTIREFDEITIVGAVFVEPEYSGRIDLPGAADGKPNPIPNWQIFRLAHAPDIAFGNDVLEQYTGILVNHSYPTGRRDLKCLVVRSIFFGLLRHQADIGNVAHRRHVERAVLSTKGEHLLVNAGIASVWNQRFRVVQIAVRAPHLSRRANSGRN